MDGPWGRKVSDTTEHLSLSLLAYVLINNCTADIVCMGNRTEVTHIGPLTSNRHA